MPIYEYKCNQCVHCFELIRPITASDVDIKCPACGGEKPQRTISTFSTGSSDFGGGLPSECAPTNTGG